MQEVLDRVSRGECKRLMLNMPPRHGKSEMVTVRYAVWRLERDPTLRVILGAYNATFVSKLGRKARRIAEKRLDLAHDRTAVDDWETAQGGGMRAVGVGGGITGQGGDLIIIDDPVKSREEAESEAYRNKCWDWYTDDLYTRLEPGGAVILIMTRWHEDDLAGRILASEKGSEWEVINLPALAEENDPLGRKEGEALCPERYDVAALEDIKATQGGYSFDALYQGHPTPREGAFFKVGKIEIVDAAPAGLRLVRAWDTAATEGDGDYTAGVKVGIGEDGYTYVVDVVRGQWSTDYRNATMRQTAELDGAGVFVRYAEDPGSAGKDQSRYLGQKVFNGFRFEAVRVSGDKVTRAEPFSSQVNAGNVRVVRGAWNRAFIEELRGFPLGKHDDQVDGASDAYTKLTRGTEMRMY